MSILHNQLQFGPHRLAAAHAGDRLAPYFLAGRRMYCVGMVSGQVQPIGEEHLAGEMGGVWAHPVKVADGFDVRVLDPSGEPPAPGTIELTQSLSHIEWLHRLGGLELQRRDFVVEDQAAFFSLLRLVNTDPAAQTGTLELIVQLKFLGCWFGGLTHGQSEYWLDGATVLGYDTLWQGHWGLACGTGLAPERCEFVPQELGANVRLEYHFDLAPGASASWEFLLAADHQRGHAGAQHLFGQLTGGGERLLAEKSAHYERVAFDGTVLATPDPAVDLSFALAKANLQLLSADYTPDLPAYFLAGVPEYPQLFGCDTEYTVPGAVAAGFAATTKSALLALADYGARACGRIPHEITTNGRVFHPGNTQETPQFAAACWDFFRWTGDHAFLRHVFPLCREGVDAYLPALWGGAGNLYPIGDGVVERHGMGARKLDSTCYLFQALEALRDMAEALGEHGPAQHYQQQLEQLAQHFEQDWWLESESMYADSLHSDGRPQLDGHWTVVLPLQLGLAAEERARRAFARIEREWVNEWGLVHTRDRENRVWTLPTGLLALTAFRYGQPEFGLRLLQNIAVTTSYGTLGAFKELIPLGLCFVQLWSAGLYIQGLLEGMLGLRPLAHLHRLEIAPQLPAGWPELTLRRLVVGDHTVSLRVWPDSCEIRHDDGPAALELRYRVPAGVEQLSAATALDSAAQLLGDARGGWVRVELAAGRQIRIAAASRGVLSLAEAAAEVDADAR